MKRLLALLLIVLLLVGCGEEEEITEEPEVTISETFDMLVLDCTTIYPFWDKCGYVEVSDRCLQIYPYYNADYYITVTEILLSDNDWWNTIIESYGDAIEVVSFEDYTMFTTPEGVTYAYKEYADYNMALVAESGNVLSGYIKLVMDNL